MALPLGGAWPPRPYDKALDAMRTWNAWYVGDSEALSTAYATATSVARPSQLAGGLVGAMSRMFWGRPGTAAQQRARLHMPVAADLCRTSAQLLFAQPPTFSIPKDQGNPVAAKRLDRIVNTAATHSALVEAAELGAALGGTFLRLVWDADVADHVMLDAVDADRAIPEFRWGRLVAVTFWTQLNDAGDDQRAVWRHLERHEPGRILHGLYEGTADKLGAPRPLQDRPETEVYAGLVDAEQAILTSSQGLTAAYVPNVRPMPAWRNVPGLADLGRPDLAGVEPLMDFIDETWSSLARDVRLAKSRIIVPEYMLQNLGVGRGSAFDTDQEVFTPLSMPPADDGAREITAQQFDIRVDEHLAAINAALREVLRAVGYSPLTFGLPDEVAATATEIHSREKDSLQTRSAKIRHWEAALSPLARTLLEVDAAVFRTGAQVTEDLELDWPDGAREPLEVRARSVQALAAAQAASIETRVKIMQPDLDEAAVAQEAARIMAEQGMAVPDPGGSFPPDPSSA